jgi:hypothetical protein
MAKADDKIVVKMMAETFMMGDAVMYWRGINYRVDAHHYLTVFIFKVDHSIVDDDRDIHDLPSRSLPVPLFEMHGSNPARKFCALNIHAILRETIGVFTQTQYTRNTQLGQV